MNAKFNYQSYFLRTALALTERKDEHKENRPSCALVRNIRILLTLLVMLTAGSNGMQAETVTYLVGNDTFSAANATQITSTTTTIAAGSITNSYYYVSGDVTISGDLTITGESTDHILIIICDGAKLTITGKIICSSDLIFVSQSSGSNSGQLIVNSTDNDAISAYNFSFNGCNMLLEDGGITTSNYILITSGQFTADRIRCNEFRPGYCYSTDFFKVNHYNGINYIDFERKFITDDDVTITPPSATPRYYRLASTDFRTIEGHAVMPHPDVIFDVTLPASSTGGTIATNKANAIKDEKVKLTFTPATGNFLTAASWNDGTNDHDISPASPTTAAYSQTITMPEHAVTVSATFTPAAASVTINGTTTEYINLVDTDSDPTNDAMSVVNNATSDVTMTLCKDITDIGNTNHLDFYNTKTVTEGSVTRPVEITLDLNGHKLSSTTSDVIWLEGGVLTIMDSGTGGEISATGNNAIGISYNGKLTINGGTFSSVNSTAINNDGNAGGTPGSITINGGAISANGDHKYGIDNKGTLTINGGTITANGSDSHGIRNIDCSLTINGGTISATGSGSSGIYSEGTSGSHATITIKGGTISGQNLGIYINRSQSYSYVDVNISGGTIKSNADGISIDANSTLTLSALPTFDCVTDIYLQLNKLIVFSADVTPASNYNIKVGITDYTTLPFKLTDGYAAHVKDANSQTIAPTDFFTYVGTQSGSIVSFNGEAYFNTTAPAASVTASSVTTDYWTLKDALADLPDNTATTIDILRDIAESGNDISFSEKTKNFTINLNGHNVTFGSLNNFLGSMIVEGLNTGDKKTFNFNGIYMMGDLIFKNVTVNCTSISDWADNDEDKMLLLDNATVVCNNSTARSLNRGSRNIQLKNSSSLTIWNEAYLGSHNFLIEIKDNSWIEFKNCVTSGYNPTRVSDQIARFVRPDITIGLTESKVTMTTGGDPSTTTDMLNLVLRASWGIVLKNGLSNATTTFYEANAGFDPTGEFDPTDYTGNGAEKIAKSPASYIDNSDGQDHYVIAYIVPADGYWTDLSLLSAVETGTSLTGDANALTLLKRDQYDAATPGDPADMRDCYNGAGWYYYTLPKGHSVAAGYTTSTLGGFTPAQFKLDRDDNVWSPTTKVLKVTDGTPNGWTVEFTYDQLSYPFDGNNHRPKVEKLTVKNNGNTVIELDGSTAAGRAAIDNQVKNGTDYENCAINNNFGINTGPAQSYPNCWFYAYDYNATYAITVPFSGSGSEADPWLIKGGDDVTLLAKCVNIGCYSFAGEFIELDENDTYDNPDDYAEFEPIGMNGGDYNTPFCGTFEGNGVTISGIDYTFNTVSSVGDGSSLIPIGLFGDIGLYVGDPADRKIGTVKNVIVSGCSFASTYDGVCSVGGIAGILSNGIVSNCYVIGSEVSAANTGSYTGAIVGKLGTATLTNNYYDYTTTATLGSSTASGYTKRGIWDGTKWDDATTSDGAVLWVKKAKISETKPTGSTSSIAFSQVTKGTDCYDISGDDFYYAVGQPITLTVTLGSRTDDIRTFYDELKSLTVSDGTTTTDIIDVLGFTMPEADATIAVEIQESSGFTIPSNGKSWMSLFHEWTDANKAPVDYTVTAVTANTGKSRTRAVTNPLELLTIKKDGIDLDAGTASTLDLGGVCFNGVPTLLHQEGGLPEKLRFDPVTGKTAPQYDPQFIGGVSDLSVYAQKSVFMLFNSELVRADLSGDASGGSITADAHRAFVVMSDAPATSRLMLISDDATGIRSIDKLTTDDADGAWYGIDGRRLQGKPTKRGLYIVNGKKVVIK